MTSKKVSIKDVLAAEVQERMLTSKQYKDKINTAKTATKKQYYQKKLKKNNEEIFKFMMGLEKLRLVDEAKQATKTESTETDQQPE